MSLDDTIRCYGALKARGIRLGTKAADHCVMAQALIDGIPQLIAIAESAEAILLCNDLFFSEPDANRERRVSRLRDAIFPSNLRVQPAATEPAEQAGRGPLGCDELLDSNHSNGEINQ